MRQTQGQNDGTQVMALYQAAALSSQYLNMRHSARLTAIRLKRKEPL
jgi:hypothetical protein